MNRKIILTTEDELRQIVTDCLKQYLHDHLPNPDDEQHYSVKELAAYFEVTEVTIHKWKKEELLPFHRIGRRIYFRKSEIMEVLTSKKKYGRK